MKELFMKLISTFYVCGDIKHACMYESISTIELERNGKKYVLSIRLEEEKENA